MEWLYRNNIKVPKLLPSYDNRRYIFYENMLFILTPWVEGEKCNFDSLSDLNLSIKKLAKLNKCSKDFIPIYGSKKRKKSICKIKRTAEETSSAVFY